MAKARSLFLIEFKRRIIPNLYSFIAVLGTLLVIERVTRHFKPEAPVSSVIDLLLVLFLLLGGFISGAAVFSQEFKQQHVLFLQTLPLGRGALWSSLVLANLGTTVLSLALVIALRPSLLSPMLILTQQSDEIRPQLEVLVFLVLFSAGLCYSLLFRSVPFVYMVGILATLAALATSFLVAEYFFSDPRRADTIIDFPSQSHGGYYSYWLVSWSLLYCLLSYWFCRAGELYLLWRRIKNVAFVVGSQVLVLAGFAAAQHFRAFTLSAETSRSITATSSDGKRLAVLESLRDHPQFSTISVIDVETGKLLGKREQNGVRTMGWSSAGDSLVLSLADDSPLSRLGYLLPASDSLLWLSPQGREIERVSFPFSRIIDEAFGAAGKTLVITRHGLSGSMRSVDESTRKIADLAGGLLDQYAYLRQVGAQRLAFFHNKVVPSRVWTLFPDVKELRWASPSKPDSSAPYVFDGLVYGESAELLAAIDSKFPYGGDATTSRRLLPGGFRRFPYSDADYLDQGMAVFLIDKKEPMVALLVFDRTKKEWLPLAKVLIGDSSWDPFIVAPAQGLAVYPIVNGTRTEAYLYDAKIPTQLALGVVNNWNIFGNIAMAAHGPSVLVQVFNSPKPIAFLYAPGTGVLKALPTKTYYSELLWTDREGNAVILDERNKVFRISSTGEQRQIWPPEGQ